MKLSEVCAIVGGTPGGPDTEIVRVAKIEDAGAGDITFLSNPKYEKYLATTNASAVLVSSNASFGDLSKRAAPLTLVRVADPYLAFLQLIERFHPPARPLSPGIHPSAVVSPGAKLGEQCAVGAHVVIGDRSVIGRGTAIHPNTVVGDDVSIGADCLVYANVTIRESCALGDRVIVHPGAVIGSDGFGFAPKPDGSYQKIPQRGTVVIEDDVEIGANCAIDRATIGETRIMRGVKLDNLIHIAHNVTIGDHTVMAAQTGVSGSTKVGKYCGIGGQVGFVGHIEIADRVTVGAQSGVSKSLKEEGKMYFGYPAREVKQSMRIEGALRQLPELLTHIRELEERIRSLEQSRGGQTT